MALYVYVYIYENNIIQINIPKYIHMLENELGLQSEHYPLTLTLYHGKI